MKPLLQLIAGLFEVIVIIPHNRLAYGNGRHHFPYRLRETQNRLAAIVPIVKDALDVAGSVHYRNFRHATGQFVEISGTDVFHGFARPDNVLEPVCLENKTLYSLYRCTTGICFFPWSSLFVTANIKIILPPPKKN